MPLRIIAGRSGSGKTHLILEEIRARLKEDPLGPPLILLVPEQATFQAEKAMLDAAESGGFLRAQVLSFRRLAFRVMQETGGLAVVPIQQSGKAMLLHKVLEARRDSLRVFKSDSRDLGLIAGLNELLTEMKRYRVEVRELEELAQRASGVPDASPLLADKLRDLSMIYADLERELAGRWMDGEDMLARLAEKAQESDWLAEAEIWLDGFHGFTPGEMAVIGALLRRAKRVSVALCTDRPFGAGERPDELYPFHPPAETSARLCVLAETCGVPTEPPVVLAAPVSPRFAASPVLAFLERAWENRSAVWQGDDALLDPANPACGLSLHAAANRRTEAEAAARDMLRRVREGGWRWRDMAVFVRRMEDYADVLSTVLADYGIPFYLDSKKSAAHHPLVELIRSALECVTGGWKAEAVFRCAKTDMLGTPGRRLSRDEVDRLENYVLAAGIDGWKWHRDELWRPLSRGDLDEDDALPEGEDENQSFLMLDLRDALLEPLLKLEHGLKRAETVRGMCAALYDFLTDTGAADWLEERHLADMAEGQPGRAAIHRPLWDAVMDLLDQLAELAGDRKMEPALFAGMIDAGLEELKIGAVPPSLDAVLIGSPERTRTGRLKIVYLLGASDGVLPMRMPESGLLTEEERERLAGAGLELAPGLKRRLLDERFLAYLTFTAPSAHLWISWPLADDEGAGLLPSEWIRRLRRRFPGLPVCQETAEPQETHTEREQLAFAVHPGRAMTHLITRLRLMRQGAVPPAGWWSVYRWLIERDGWKERLMRLMASLNYKNEEKPLSPDTSLLLYGERLLASVSRIERFAACPFLHFASHGLRLKERKIYRVDAPDIGLLFHAVMRQTAEKIFHEGGAGASLEDWQREAAAAVERIMPRVQSQIFFSSHRHQAMARKLREIARQASAMLGEHAKVSAFRPVGLELDFGPKGALPPLTLDLGGGRYLDLAGRIDRVDAAETPEGYLLRILDYKSGPVKLRLDEVAQGLALQMLAYLDVVVTHAPHWLGKPAEPAGVLYFRVHNPIIPTPNGLTADEARDALIRQFRMQGLVLSDSEAVKRMDRTLETSAKSVIIPVEFKKDGSFSARSQVADRSQWQLLRSAVRGHIRRAGRRILSGEVAIAPYKMNQRTPCAYCAYRSVCQFDPALEGNGYQRLTKSSGAEELWSMLGQAAEGRGLE